MSENTKSCLKTAIALKDENRANAFRRERTHGRSVGESCRRSRKALQGMAGDLQARAQRQLVENVMNVALDGIVGHMKLLRDFFITQPFGD